MRKLITLLILISGITAQAHTKDTIYNGGERIEYIGLYSYRGDKGQIVFKNATQDWNSIREFKEAKKKYGFRLEDISKSTANRSHKLENQRRNAIEKRKFFDEVMAQNIKIVLTK